MGDKYDLAYLSVNDIAEDTSAPASGDYFLRYDTSAGKFKKVDGTSLGAMSGINATAAEINATCDQSARVVNITDDATLTQATHGEKIVTVDDAAGAAITLPAATGTGMRIKIVITTTITSNSTTIKAASASDSFVGSARGVDDDVEGATGYQWNAETNDDTVTLDGSATGGKAGDYFILEDVASGVWLVEGSITQSGGSEATPFSATVS